MSLKAKIESLIWKGWAIVFSNPSIYRLKILGIAKIVNFAPDWLPLIRNWTLARSKISFSKKNLHQLVQEEGLSNEY